MEPEPSVPTNEVNIIGTKDPKPEPEVKTNIATLIPITRKVQVELIKITLVTKELSDGFLEGPLDKLSSLHDSSHTCLIIN